jgi:hypothetical protein
MTHATHHLPIIDIVIGGSLDMQNAHQSLLGSHAKCDRHRHRMPMPSMQEFSHVEHDFLHGAVAIPYTLEPESSRGLGFSVSRY